MESMACMIDPVKMHFNQRMRASMCCRHIVEEELCHPTGLDGMWQKRVDTR